MCGIVGKIVWTPGGSVPKELLGKMAERLRHRGPDEGGIWAEGPVGLAMRRLKVIDLASGQQPMSNEHCPHHGRTGTLRLIYNGEIYNFQSLRTELESRGHRFRTASDTETILHAYEEFGEEAWDRLNGMFALALYAEREKTLTLVRDRMGVKPLYYRSTGRSFSFASEIKALLEDPETSREWDLQALGEFFSLRYVPTPRSIFREIRKLEPGHVLKIRDGRTEKRRYWTFSPPPAPRRPLSSYLEQLDSLLKESVRTHMVSDVPVGVFLSGGLDSTTVAAYVHETGRRLKSFTIYFPNESFSERREAALAAERYGLEHNEMEVHADLREAVDKLSEVFDEPFADSSAIPVYYLSRFARSQVTVALSGDGGDELFAGYPTYIADRLSAYYRRFPGMVHRLLLAMSRCLPVSYERISFDYRVKAFLHGARRAQPHAHFGWQEMLTPEEKSAMVTPEVWREMGRHEADESFSAAYDEAGARNELEKMLYVDQRTHLLDEYLVKVDRVSMAHSLEVRVPLLDRSLVEFAAGIPPAYKLSGFTTKYILRRMMRNRLPKEVVSMKKKGFSPPLAHWLAGEWLPWAKDRLSPANLRKTGVLDPALPQKLLQEHADRKRDHYRRLWVLLCFMSWFDKYGRK
ncbi:MAG TPA: asparagine synthase (glutamine-hydrolyzing) [Elusimicrobiota bacterium]|nr:asparagine synthase (glutamine-hydrolyzing) [Elusimicrobiota bacterium]